MRIQSVNPYNNEVLEEYKLLSAELMKEKVALSNSKQAYWQKTSFANRAIIIKKTASLLKEHLEHLARLASLEMGKPIREARAEVLKCAQACNYYAENAEILLKTEEIATDNKKSLVYYEPWGIVLGIMPWNFPYWQVFRFAIPALMAGNCVLLKHASNVPQCALAIEALFIEAGLDTGIFQTLLIDAKQAISLLSNSVIKSVSLTGSVEAGAIVASEAGKNIKKSVLELGGSDAFIVLADADMEKAAEMAVRTRLQNNGQSCIAAKRFIVDASVIDDFIRIVKSKLDVEILGDPIEEDTTLGPLAKKEFALNLQKQLKHGLEQDATLYCGGYLKDAFFAPALVKVNSAQNSLFVEETFGPVMAVLSVNSEEEAIAAANNSLFGLGASIWTKDLDKGAAIARRINAGSVFVNTIVKSDVRLPFGGINRSGYGRELSHQGIKEFTYAKSVVIN